MTDKMVLQNHDMVWSASTLAGNGGCGWDSCSDDEYECDGVVDLTSENMAENIAELDEEYYGIFDEGHISPWKKESTGEEAELYVFTKEQLQTLEDNRAYMRELLKELTAHFENLLNEYLNSCEVAGVDRILRSGDAMIVFWDDGDKTVVKRAADEKDSDYVAFTAALGKKIYGSNSKLTRFIKNHIEYQEKKENKTYAE